MGVSDGPTIVGTFSNVRVCPRASWVRSHCGPDTVDLTPHGSVLAEAPVHEMFIPGLGLSC